MKTSICSVVKTRTLILSFFLFSFFFFGAKAFSESGSAAQLIRETHLKKDPTEDSPSLGRLPKGTILILKGNQKNGFVEVSVELEEGAVEGWLRGSDLSRRSQVKENQIETDETPPPEEGASEGEAPRRIRKKVAIPKDEGLLLRRDTSFFYGLQGGGNYSLLQSVSQDYPGMGVLGSFFFGFFLDRELPLRLEVGYLQMNGAGLNNESVKVGHVEGAVNVGYQIEAFEIFAALSYAHAININDAPNEIKSAIEKPSDLSSFYGGGGAGVRFPMGEFTDVSIRARFMMSFYREPVAFQSMALQLGFQFRG